MAIRSISSHFAVTWRPSHRLKWTGHVQGDPYKGPLQEPRYRKYPVPILYKPSSKSLPVQGAHTGSPYKSGTWFTERVNQNNSRCPAVGTVCPATCKLWAGRNANSNTKFNFVRQFSIDSLIHGVLAVDSLVDGFFGGGQFGSRQFDAGQFDSRQFYM